MTKRKQTFRERTFGPVSLRTYASGWTLRVRKVGFRYGNIRASEQHYSSFSLEIWR